MILLFWVNCLYFFKVKFCFLKCDSRKQGHVILIIDSEGLKLQACTEDGQLESKTINIEYDNIEKVETNEKEKAFIINFKSMNKPSRAIQLFSEFVSTFFKILNVNFIWCNLF